MSQEFEEIMATANPQVQALARTAKGIIKEVMPNVKVRLS